MAYLHKEEGMSRDELSSLQSERLRAVVKRVYDNVEIYRKKMDEIGLKPEDIKDISDITKLPFTVKHDLRESYPFGFFATDRKNIVRVHASSGTTGKLTVVGYTQRDLDMWSDMCARCLSMTGATSDDIVHVSYGYGLFTGGLGLNNGAERLGAMTVPASSGATARQLMLMKDFGATTICCTPSYAIYLGETIKKEGMSLSDFSLKRGVFGAEPWSDEMRRDIEKLLGIKAYDIYGLSEIMGPGVAIECEEQKGLHMNEDNFFAEIINPETLEPVKDGEQGELVITTLTKEGIPLIRYRTRDITSFYTDKCACGREFKRIKRISGRSDDMLIIRGVNVFPSQIESVLLNIGDAITPHYQIIVDRNGALDTFEIQIEMSEKFFSDEVAKIQELRRRIEHDMLAMLSISAKITLVSPNTISRSEGKAKRIIDNRK